MAITAVGVWLAAGVGCLQGRAALKDAKAETTLVGHGDSVRCLAFTKDGKTLASGSTDRTVKLWDVAAGKERATLKGHKADVLSVAFSPDGKLLASGGMDNTAKLWDAMTGREEAA
jgi:WD40 repeat protein